MKTKLDPKLSLHGVTHRARIAAATEHEKPKLRAERVTLLVQFRGDLADLQAVGFEPNHVSPHPTSGFTIATGTIPSDRVADLDAIEHVVTASLPEQLYPHLNYSVPETRANVLHDRTPGVTGMGTVIGIVDTGIDWRHGDFAGFDGRSTRILGIWDQLLSAQAGETAGPNGAGVVYTTDQIASALQGVGTVRALDGGTRSKDARHDAGHGTHVAGIAAGDGEPPACCHGTGTFTGMAPRASLIVVRSDLTDANVVPALDYIFNHPAAAGQPIVVNLSFGGNYGAHDGTTVLESHIDALIKDSSGRAVVVSAGNSAAWRTHARGVVPANGQIDVTFDVLEHNEHDINVDLWYDSAAMLDLQVTPPGQSASAVAHGSDMSPTTFAVNPGASTSRQSTGTIFPHINNPNNQDNRYFISVAKPTNGDVPDGTGWKLTLFNRTAVPANFHCWLMPDGGLMFLPSVNPPDGKVRASTDTTITMPGTAAGAITVANYVAKSSWCNCFPTNQVAASSSRGPVAKGAATNPKPDIAAPGTNIESAKADACNLPGNCCSCCPDTCCLLYEDKSGTSMSAPHVTGAIALLLEQRPHMTKAQILSALQNSARDRPAGGYDTSWGAGKLDAAAAVDAVTGGPPPGEMTSPMSMTSLFGRNGVGVSLAPPPSMAGLPPALQVLRAHLARLPEGELMTSLISRHFSEVRRLINTNVRIATMWHRARGPVLLRTLIHGLNTPSSATVLTESDRKYLDRWLRLLMRYGTSQVRRSVEQYGPKILGALFHAPVPT